MSQPITAGRIKLIEDLFLKYPDTPREIIIKQDLCCLGNRFSDSALAAAASAEKKNYALFGSDLDPMSNMPRQEYLKAPGTFAFKGGPYNLRPVCVATINALDSPYLIDAIDGRLKLYLDGVAIADVGYRPPPKYYSKSFPDGTAYRDIIRHGGGIIPFGLCQFWGAGEECKFCDINENARQRKEFKTSTLAAPVPAVEQVAEVANEIGREVLERDGYPSPIEFTINGGTIARKLHGFSEEDFYLQYVEAVKWGGPRRYVQLFTGAAEKETLQRYHYAGVDIHKADIEVWDKRLFEWLCPGKSRRVGWEEWIRRMIESVDIFGEGNITPNFVGGVEMAQPYGFKTLNEAVKSTTEGFRYLSSYGVMPQLGQWKRRPLSYLLKNHSQPPVPPEYYIQVMSNYYENWKRYGLPLPHRIDTSPEFRFLGNSHNIHEDYLIIMEEKDYENRALEALEKADYIWSC